MNSSKRKIHSFKWLKAFARVTCVASVIFALSPGSIAKAASIPILKNVTTGETIFHDDFENHDQTVVTLPSVSGLPTSAVVGTWSSGFDFGGRLNYHQGVVNSASSIGGIEAAEGDQFFQISTPGENQGTAMTGVGVPTNSMAGHTIEANLAFYVATGSVGAYVYFYDGSDLLAAFLLNGDYSANVSFSLSAFDNIAGTPGQGGFQQQGLNFTPDAWNTMKVVHVIGTDDWTVSINDGASITVAGYQASSGYLVDSIYLNQTAATTVYFDAVAIPED